MPAGGRWHCSRIAGTRRVRQQMILVTGSAGLVGQALLRVLSAAGYPVRKFDLRTSLAQDLRHGDALAASLEGVTGIVHLAAVSRVAWAERDPVLCEAVNVSAVRLLLDQAMARRERPWLVFASSREVYGDAALLPVAEDAPFAPCNTYARSKVAGERLVSKAREAGLLANVVRLGNVYGATDDHPDRVVPAFAKTAAIGGTLVVHGGRSEFDFTHVDDVARGLVLLVEATAASEWLPPINFASGCGTTLLQLAAMAQDNARIAIALNVASPRPAHVERFIGDPARAEKLLGWKTQIGIQRGFADLVTAFRNAGESHKPAPVHTETAPRSEPLGQF